MPVVASETGAVDGCDIEGLAEAAQAILDQMGRGDWELSLLICDDAFIAPLNEQWRSKNGPTDVLSFPQLQFESPNNPSETPPEPVLLGDVVISYPTATRQALELGHSVELELVVLLVHGICHLLGHTHDTEANRTAMQSDERRVMQGIEVDAVGLIARASSQPG